MRIIIILLSITLLFTPLVSAKEKGNIQIYCQPKVKVFVNGRFKSKSKEKYNGLLLKNLSYGRYKIKLSRDKLVEYYTVELIDTLVEYYSERFTRPEDSSKVEKDSTDFGFYKTDVSPEMIFRVAPNYPYNLKGSGLTGSVWINVLVGEDGAVIEANVRKSSGTKLFDDVALIVAFENKFKPASYKGVPTIKWVTYNEYFKEK